MTKQHVDACDVVTTKLIGRVTYIYIYIYIYFFFNKKRILTWSNIPCILYLDEIIYSIFVENCLNYLIIVKYNVK